MPRDLEKHRATCRRWKAEHPEENKKYLQKWRVSHVEEIRKYLHEYKKRPEVKIKRLAYMREWRKRHPEKVRSRARKYYSKKKTPKKNQHPLTGSCNRIKSANHRGQKMKAGVLSPVCIDLLWKAQSGLCRLCSADMVVVNYHLDHIVPLSKGGRNTDINMQLLCPSCNRSKNATIMPEIEPVLI